MSKDILQRKRILTKASSGSSISTPISVANGGTGLSSYTVGDLIYASGATTLSKLAIGTANQQLRVNAGATALEYFTPAAGGITVGTTTITSGTSNRILYQSAGGVVTQKANFTMDAVATGVLDIPVGLAITGLNVLKVANDGISMGWGTTGIVQSPTQGSSWYGYLAGFSVTGTYNTFLGTNAGRGVDAGSVNICIGAMNVVTQPSGLNSIITLGYNAVATASNQGILGSNSASGYISNWYFNGVTHTAAYSTVLNACGGSGSNNVGANLTLAAGKGTGTANAGDYKVQTSVKGASGATLQTLGDRKAIIGKYVDLVDSTPTSFLRINVPTGTVAGGRMLYSIESNDGTDYQCFTEEARWSIINKAGTLTIAISTAPGFTDATAASTGTLTATLTAVDSGSGNADFELNAISSLTATVLRVNCVVFKNFGTGSITSL